MVDKRKPPAEEIEDFHTNDDLDGAATAHHHSLGSKRTQASPGDHTHDGGSSKQLLEGITISGVKAGNTALASVIAALVALGATDTTT